MVKIYRCRRNTSRISQNDEKFTDFGEPQKNIAIKKRGKEKSGSKSADPACIVFLVFTVGDEDPEVQVANDVLVKIHRFCELAMSTWEHEGHSA